MSLQLNGTAGVTYNDGSNQPAAASPYGLKNLIINGDMQLAQRGTSVAGITGTGYYTCDRWQTVMATAGTWTMTQDTSVPTGQGFANSMKYQCTTANASLSAGSVFTIQTQLEAQNLQHLKFGTANAQTLTCSFWVKSNKTGTYTYYNFAPDGNRIRGQEFTINTADTWEKKTFIIDGDTAGTFNNDNGSGLTVSICVLAGSNFTSGTFSTSWEAYSQANQMSSNTVNLADSTSNYINITGVQLEIGDTATPFENRMYSTELAMCQRYFQSFGGTAAAETVGVGTSYSTTSSSVLINLLQTMRSVPSLGYSAVGDWRVHYPGITGQEATAMSLSTNDSNNTKVIVNPTTASNGSMGGGKCIHLTADSTINARLTFSAEL